MSINWQELRYAELRAATMSGLRYAVEIADARLEVGAAETMFRFLLIMAKIGEIAILEKEKEKENNKSNYITDMKERFKLIELY